MASRRMIPRYPRYYGRSRRVLLSAFLGGETETPDYTGSTLTASVFALTANGSATTTLEATVTRNAELASGVTVEYEVSRTSVSASLSSVSGSSAIANDGVEVATCYVTVLDANGVPLPGIPAASCVMAVTGTGNTLTQPTGFTDADGRIAGTFVSTVSATKVVSWTIAGQAITATQSVTVGSGVVTPDLEVNWGSYANQAAVEAASWWQNDDYTFWGDATAGGLELVTETGPTSQTKVMRQNFIVGSVGTSSPGFRLNVPGTATGEVWIEAYFKVSTDFVTTGTGGGNPDYKHLFAAVANSGGTVVGRNELKIGNYGNMNYYDSRYNSGPDTLRITTTPNAINSGNWYRIRYHNKVGTTGADISSFEFWDLTNSPQQLDQTGYTTTGSVVRIPYFLFGANRNLAAAATMSIRTERIRVWSGAGAGDPGWGF